MRRLFYGIIAAVFVSALCLTGCAPAQGDGATSGTNPYVTPGGTEQVFALYEPGLKEMPLPNDLVWQASGGKVYLAPTAGGDPLMEGLKTAINALELPGLSPNMFLSASFTGEVDPKTIEIFSFRIDGVPETPKMLNNYVKNFSVTTSDLTNLNFVPSSPFSPGASYAVAIKANLKDKDGYPVKSSFAMEALKSETPFPEGHPYFKLEALRAKYSQLLGGLALATSNPALTPVLGPAWTRGDVLLLWTFKTASVTLNNTGNGVLAYPTSGNDTFGAQTAGLYAVAPSTSYVAQDITAGIPAQVPKDKITAFYGGYFSGVAAVNPATDAQIDFIAALPSVGVQPYPVAIFQHGLMRSKEDVLALANTLASAGVAVIAIDAPFHGGRVVKDAENNDIPFFSANMLLDRANLLQGAYDLMTVSKSLGGLDLDNDGTGDFDTSKVKFASHSLGSIIGSVYLNADASPERILLSSPTAGIANVLDQTTHESITPIVASLGYVKGTVEYNIFLNLTQWLLDPVDGAYMKIGANTPDELLGIYAWGDDTVSDASSLSFLRGAGAAVYSDVVYGQINPGVYPAPSAGAYRYTADSEGNRVPTDHSFLLQPWNPADTPKWLITYAAQGQAAGFFAQ
jgi:hypothetical protein